CWLALSSDAMNSARCWLVTLRSLPILMLWSWPVRSRKYTLSRPTCRISATCSTVYACTARLTSSLSSLLLVVACRGHEAGTSFAVTVRDCLGLSTSCVSSPLRADARVDSRHRQLLWVIGDGSPAAVADPGGLATAGQLAELLVDPRAAHARCLHQVRYRTALLGRAGQGGQQNGRRVARGISSARAAGVILAARDHLGGLVNADGPRCLVGREPGYVIEERPDLGVLARGGADGFVGEQVRAGTAGNIVLGSGDQEFSGRVERVRVPSGGEHSLAEDEVDIFALADAKADADVHLRSDGAFSHGFLGRALGCRDQGDRDGTAAAGDGIGVGRSVWRVVGKLRVLVNDDDKRGHFR